MRHPKPSPGILGPSLLALAFFLPGAYLITHAPNHAIAQAGLGSCALGIICLGIIGIRNAGR